MSKASNEDSEKKIRRRRRQSGNHSPSDEDDEPLKKVKKTVTAEENPLLPQISKIVTADEKYQKVIDAAANLKLDELSLTYFFSALEIEDREFGGNRINAPKWKLLYNLIPHEDKFRNYVETIVAEVREKTNEKCLVSLKNTFNADGISEKSVLAFIESNKSALTTVLATGSGILFVLPESTKTYLLNIISTCGIQKLYEYLGTGAIPDICSLAKLGNSVSIILAIIPVVFQILRSAYQWSNKEISGKRALQQIIDTIATVLLGVAGALAGTVLTSDGGPLANVTGGVIGGISAGMCGKAMAKIITDELLDLPKSTALDKAYKYLKIDHHATSAQVQEAYEKQALIDRPIGGAAFCRLQTYMQIIRTDPDRS